MTETLINHQTRSEHEWSWYRQLKYQLRDHARVQMCKGDFDYSYEYQGNAAKLVHTPLTDKCYLTLT